MNSGRRDCMIFYGNVDLFNKIIESLNLSSVSYGGIIKETQRRQYEGRNMGHSPEMSATP